MKFRLFLSLSVLFCCINICFSQTYSGGEANKVINNAMLIKFKNHSKVPNYVRFSENATLSEKEAVAIIKNFITDGNSDLQFKKVQKNTDSTLTIRYYQTVSGYPIEFSALNLQVKNGKVTEISGNILDNPHIIPHFILSEEEALQSALHFVDAEIYMWQEDSTYLPEGEKVIVPNKITFDKSKLKSAYKFAIYSLKPYDGKTVYVDAQTGEIILDIPLIHFSNTVATAQTAYYGQQTINTYLKNGQYILLDTTRGGGIHTYDCHDEGNYYSATDFYNNSTNWNSTQTKYATDAHFSTTMTYDYYKQIHGYNSIDNNDFPLKSYVHYNLVKSGGYSDNVNAFWNGRYMTYGDGDPSRNITPLTTIDICGHEITHGLTEFTAKLVYSYEPGALNEAFSDIFGKAIERFAVPAQADWLMGSKIGKIMRSMQNPNAYNNPNTYKGNYWVTGSSDNGGVHTNSSVLNYWFYLLCEGGTGTNDFGKSYHVTALGISKAEQIAFKLLTQYLDPNSGYEDACFYGLQAAAELYGGCSIEVQAVAEAFYAVGVLTQPYPNYAVANFSANITESCSSPMTVLFSNQSYNADSYFWDFGDGSTSTDFNPIHTYLADGNYTVKLIASSINCGTDTIIKQNYIQISPHLPCIYFMTQGYQNVEACRGIIYDDGGENAPHSSNVMSTLTVHSTGADSIVVRFLEFDLEPCSSIMCECDYLSVYSGNSIFSNLIGKYCNMNRPDNTITVAGDYVTFYFYSDPYVNLEGFKIEFFCVNPFNPPIASFGADKTKSCEGIIHFKDHSVGSQINSWFWDFGDGNTSTMQNPTHQYYKNGTYTVTLTVGNANGKQTVTKTNYIVLNEMNELGDYKFSGNKTKAFEMYIPAGSQNLKWYDNNNDNLWETKPVFTGNPVQHPPVLNNQTYYILDTYGGGEYQVGETDCTLSNGGYFNTAGIVHYLIFDAYQKFYLQSVLVNAISSGNRSIMLRDFSQNVIWTKNVYIPVGTSRITINKEVPVGVNLQLACQAESNLFRSNTNARLSYPYKVENVVSIKSSSAGGADALKYYYYFYDWEIKISECGSELGTVTITSGVGIEENMLNKITIIPNPSKGIFQIENVPDIENHSITVSEITGKTLIHNNLINNNIIDLSAFANGLYFVRIDDKVFKVVKY